MSYFYKYSLSELKAKYSRSSRIINGLNGLPSPAAFRDVAIGLREIIRAKAKNKDDFSSELSALYCVAAVYSFCAERSEKLKLPGFNVYSLLSPDDLFALPFDYKTLGFEHLQLFLINDRNRAIKLWGTPRRHSTLHKDQKVLWKTLEKEFEKRDACLSAKIMNATTDRDFEEIDMEIARMQTFYTPFSRVSQNQPISFKTEYTESNEYNIDDDKDSLPVALTSEAVDLDDILRDAFSGDAGAPVSGDDSQMKRQSSRRVVCPRCGAVNKICDANRVFNGRLVPIFKRLINRDVWRCGQCGRVFWTEIKDLD